MLIDKLQHIEFLAERQADKTHSLSARAVRKALVGSLRAFGVPKSDPIVTVTMHGAEFRLRSSHLLVKYLSKLPFYESALPSFVRRLHQQSKSIVRVLDVGANVGYTASIIAAGVGAANVDFICVEPDPLNLPLLRENLRSLSANIIEAAAGATTRKEKANFVRDHGTTHLTVGQGSTVPIVRLDEVVKTPVQLIKIDTDGFELEVLRGLTETIARDSPHLFIEVSPTHLRLVGKHDPMEVITLLRDLGYTDVLIYDGDGYPISAGRLDSPVIAHLISYASARPSFLYDFLLSAETGLIAEFYREELARIGTSQMLF